MFAGAWFVLAEKERAQEVQLGRKCSLRIVPRQQVWLPAWLAPLSPAPHLHAGRPAGATRCTSRRPWWRPGAPRRSPLVGRGGRGVGRVLWNETWLHRRVRVHSQLGRVAVGRATGAIASTSGRGHCWLWGTAACFSLELLHGLSLPPPPPPFRHLLV